MKVSVETKNITATDKRREREKLLRIIKFKLVKYNMIHRLFILYSIYRCREGEQNSALSDTIIWGEWGGGDLSLSHRSADLALGKGLI